MNTPRQPATPMPPDQHGALTLEDLCRACAVQSEVVLAMLEEGVIEPAEGQTPESWRFTAIQVHHVSVAWRLQRDLGVNLPGAALALQLLDEVETLRAQLAAQALASRDIV
jgi:chaperone modulatory protein CbpM